MLFGLFGKLTMRELQLSQPPLHLIDLRRHAFQLHGNAAGCLVNQVDGLVGQETIGDVTIGKLRRRDERRNP